MTYECPDTHRFGEGNNEWKSEVEKSPTAQYHVRRAELLEEWKVATADMKRRHAAELLALDAAFTELHNENARQAGFRR